MEAIQIIAGLEEIRECCQCSFETKSERCVKCGSHSFIIYVQKRKPKCNLFLLKVLTSRLRGMIMA